MKKLYYLLTIYFLLQLNVIAQQNFWEPTNGPYGGFVHAFGFNSSGVIFVGTETGVYRSTNDGESWAEINNGLPTYRAVECIAINSDDHIFIGTWEGIFRSTDNGENWIDISNGLLGSYKSIIIDSSGNIYTGITGGGIFRSSDEGESWTVVYNDYGTTEFNSLAINSKGYIFSGFDGRNGDGILRSTDNGNTWIQQLNYSAESLVITTNNFVFAGTTGLGVLRSTDDGLNWAQVNNGITDSISSPHIHSLTTNNTGNIFAAGFRFIYGGSIQSRVWRSTDYGDSWIEKDNGLPENIYNIYDLAVDSSGNIFAGTEGKGIYQSTDNGESWNEKNNGLNNTFIVSLLISSEANIFASVLWNGLFRLTNGVLEWEKIFEDSPGNSSLIKSNGSIFSGIYGKGVFRSNDNGDNWIQVNNGLTSNHILALAAGPTGTIYAGIGEVDAEIFQSTDNGETWLNMGHYFSHVRWSMNIAVNSFGHIFVGTGEGIYRSTDGLNWGEINNGLPNPVVVQCIMINSLQHVFIGTYSGVFRSTNIGNDWSEINNGISNTNIESLASNSGLNIFAGTTDGIFQSTNNGDDWIEINNNLINPSVHSLAFSSDNHLYCGTSSGVFHTTMPITSIENNNTFAFSTFEIHQNYPNPFNPSTKISWQSPVSGWQTLKVYDVLGNEVATLVDEYKAAGSYEIEFNPASSIKHPASGIYFYQLQAGDYVETKKMIFLK